MRRLYARGSFTSVIKAILMALVVAIWTTTAAFAVVINQSAFDADVNGWAITLWRNGVGDGTMAWTSGAGNPGGAIRMIGYGMTDSDDKCTREGGEMTKTISTVGYTNIGVSYDLRVSALGGAYTGTGTGSSCPIDHGLIDEQITVSYSVDAGSTWSEAEYLLRNALLSGYQSYGTRTINLSGGAAVNNNAGFMLKFRWQVNSPADICDLDNIIVSGSLPDTTPPGNVTGFTATPGPGQVSLSWTNPTDPDFAGTKIMFKTTDYPTGQADGTQVYNSGGTSCVHNNLTGGVTYYYKAFAFDNSNNYASGAQASAVPTAAPPANVSNFTAVPADTQVALSWTNPTVNFTGVKIMFKTTGYPSGPTDGTQIYDGNGTSYTHASLTNGVTCYYTAYAHDATPLYASGAQATAIPSNAVPVFGGSISPSMTNSLTPTITITAQDTGTGLNVGSAEFACSLDGGTTFGAYVGRYILHSSGTGEGGGNKYWYPDFYHPTYTIASGDHLQYDIYSNNADGTGAVEIEGSFGNLRDSGKTDQNGLSPHASTNISSRDYHQWYHRDFDLSSWAGHTITAYEMAHETDSGLSDFYVRNVVIVNNGVIKDKACDAEAWTSVGDTVVPFNNGYSSTVGPEMLTTDPASPASCTGSNGTTAQQTVTANFACDGPGHPCPGPLLPGANNCIKFRIANMGGARTTSAAFSVTVDQMAPTCAIGSPSASSVCVGGSFSYPVTYSDLGSSGLTVNLTTDRVHVSTQSGTASATISGISNGTTATPTVNLTNATGSGTLRIYIDGGAAIDGAGNTDAGATASVNVTVSSGDVTGFTATPGNAQIALSWTIPGCGGYTSVKIMFKTTGYPTGPTDGTQAYDGSGSSHTHTGLTNGTTYYYTAYARDAVPNYTSGVQASAIPSSGPPGNVSGFSTSAGNAQVGLSWTNPGASFTGVKIVFKTTGYPTGPADGTQIYDSNGTNYTHTGLTNGTMHYYTAYAHDGVPNYASGAQASATPTSGIPGGNISIHSSRRYYCDSSGKPVFLVGYYDWGEMVAIGAVNDYRNMIINGGPYKINYIRVTCGVNTSGPPNYTGHTLWPYVNGKAVLANQTALPNIVNWDPVFFNGMRDVCQTARNNNMIVNICFFDGVNLRDYGGALYGYTYSPWNPNNHDKTYYPAGNYGDCVGCFYRVNDFNNNTGVGYYQRALIDKVIDTTADFDNVMYQIGNELSADVTWNQAVINYVKTKTVRPITVCGSGIPPNTEGVDDHWFQCVLGAKSKLATLVGYGYPAWVDPDNNEWPDCFGLITCTGDCAAAYAAVDNGQRQGAWQSLAGGGAVWGGFTEDFWEWPQPHRGFSTTMGQYYMNLQNFLTNQSVGFWNMTPQHNLVSNNTYNSCLANQGVEYLAYIFSDGTATVDLTALSGNAYYKLYDPAAGTYSTQQTVAGGAIRSFNKPAGAGDWAIHVYTIAPAPTQMLNVKSAGAITIDGGTGDWALSDFTMKIRGGQGATGDYAFIGYEGSGCYYAGRNTGLVLPTGSTDHTARVYCRHDANYLYFLARCDDTDIRYSNPTSANSLNDCVEIFIDPSDNGGSTSMSNSTSDVRLVIDAGNQVNVYDCAPSYTSQVLAGVTSAVVRDGSGWWLEARLAKNALSPAIPSSGSIGIDFAFRDNDGNDNPTQTSHYNWADHRSGASFPVRIPDNWAGAFMVAAGQGPYPGPNPPSVPGVIQAENYDTGGEGVSYHDTSSGNSGAVYRSEDVDIQATFDTGGGYNVGWITTGEWLAYTVNVSAGGSYDLKMRVASLGSGGSFHIEANGQNVTGSKSVPSTAGNQNWTNVIAYGVSLNAGQQILKVVVESGGWNFNYLDIQTAVPPVTCGWNAVRQPVSLGIGQMPTVGVDSIGNVHVVYGSGATIQYRKFDRNLVLLASETIAAPNGNGDWTWPDIEFDANDVPHVIFSQHIYPEANKVWYTNRIGGAWKTPMVAIDATGVGVVVYPRLIYRNGYCYTNSMIWGSPAGWIVRLTNLSGTPTVDRTTGTPFWTTIAGDGAGNIYACGRNGPSGHWMQKYDSNLNPVGSTYEVSACKVGKTSKASGMYGDRHGVVHFVMDCQNTSGSGGNSMLYNSTARRNGDGSFQCGIQGLQSTGPDPDGNPPGWWNDDVWEVVTLDATDTIYVAYREHSPTGTGLFTKISGNNFVEPPTAFAPTIQRQQSYNCEIAPAKDGGIYVTYFLGGFAYIKGIGTGCWTPGPVTNFSATPGNNQVALSWVNPVDAGFAGVKILAKTTGYPTSQSDGALVYIGNGNSALHTGLTNGVKYYYSAYAHNSTPAYSTAAQASATPQVLPEWINETFDGYENADLGGQGAWASIGGSGQVQSTIYKGASGKAALFDTVAQGTSVANQVVFLEKTGGYCTVDFDTRQDATGTAGEELAYVCVYGSDSSNPVAGIRIRKSRIVVDYGSGSQTIMSASISNGVWYNVRVVFNCNDKTFDLFLDNISKGAGFAWASGASRISRVVIGSDRNTNLTPQKLYIDNLRVEPRVGQVVTVTDDGSWSPSASKLHFTFTPVPETVEYRYAVGTSSGGTQIRDWTSCGTSTDVTATGLTLTEGSNYYISVVCATQFGTVGPYRASNGIKVAPGLSKINDAKALADGTSSNAKALRGKLVSVPFTGYFYIQEPYLPSGLKVVSTASVAKGDLVDVCGPMKGAGAERYMDGTGNGVFKTTPGPGGPYPPAIDNRALGGGLLNANTPGVVGGVGPNNIGLYVTIYGKVTQRQETDPKYMYIDDGSGLADGTTTGGVPNVGVRVIADPSAYPAGSYVVVTGIVSCFDLGGLRPRLPAESITILFPGP